jgi:serine protease Do
MPAARGQVVNSGFIGVGIQEIDSERAKTLKLPQEAGVEITRVDQDSPADKAGLKTGDVVTEYNGQRVEGIAQFSRLVRETPVGRDVRLNIIRNGAAQTVTVKVGSRRSATVFGPDGNITIGPLGPFNVRIPDIPRSRMTWRSALLGVEAETLEGQLAGYFGVTEGVLVRSVTQGSAADKAGIKAGDVITRIDNSKVTSASDLSSRIRSQQGKSVSVVLTREHKEMTVTVMIAEADRGSLQRRRRAQGGLEVEAL